MSPRHQGPAGLPTALAGAARTLVMGVLNVTPDSFSDGGRFATAEQAVAAGVAMAAAGADLVDVGGESTRPGAQRVSVEVELERVGPVVAGLVAAGVVVSIDTTRASVAAAAVGAGASVVNDVSGGLGDPAMLPWVATVDVPYVLMHWRGLSAQMDTLTDYGDVLADVTAELGERLAAAERAGVDPARVVLDPGIGFAKTAEQNWPLLGGLATLSSLGRPLLVGASRKRFLGVLLAGPDGTPRPPAQRDVASAAVSALAAAAGVWCVRVHDVAASVDAVAVGQAWEQASLTARATTRVSP